MSLARPGASQRLSQAIDQFAAPAGYLAAATIGLPLRATLEVLREDLDRWAAGEADPARYDAAIARTRAHYARLVGVPERQVAMGSQTSVMTSLVAAAVPPGTEVLCVAGDFSSIVFPFLQRTDIRVRHVPLEGLADAINDHTWLVAFSLVQSATGQVADVDAILREAHLLGAHTLCDTTQAAGVMPVDASRFDVTVCHAYKWLCSPRGVAFMTLADRFASLMRPLQAGWYAGADVGASRYGPTMRLADDARRFDVQRLRRQFHRRGRTFKFPNSILHIPFLKVLAHPFDRHLRVPPM